jgi:hypothetical protein
VIKIVCTNKENALERRSITGPVTQSFMVKYHKYDAQMKISQYYKLKITPLFLKILRNLHFMYIKRDYKKFIFDRAKFFNKKWMHIFKWLLIMRAHI